MKYTIVINQAGIAAAGLADKTNLDHWAILDYIAGWQINHHATLREGHVWINLKHMLGEMPLLRTQTKQGLSKLIQQLQSLGLVTAIHDADKRLYLKLTPLYHDTVGFRACQQNSDGVNHGGQGVNSGGQRPVNSGGHTAVNQFSIDNQDTLKGYSAFADNKNPELFPAEPLSQSSTQPQNPRLSPKENIAAKPERAPLRRRLPGDWRLDPHGPEVAYALAKGMKIDDVRTEAENFRNHHRAKGSVMADWSAAWRTWVGNWHKFKPKGVQNGRQNYANKRNKQDEIEQAARDGLRLSLEAFARRSGIDAGVGNPDGDVPDDECFWEGAGVIEGDYTVVS